MEQAKKLVGEKAAEFVEDGMKVGLGTGSTVYWTILKLAQRVREEGLRIQCIPTSIRTRDLAEEHGISLTSFATVTELDVAIDGADEVDEESNLIKGGGGALTREKLVASAAKKFIVVADNSKIVDKLGRFALPIEIVPFAHEATLHRLSKFDVPLALRMVGENPYVTDNGNFIVDCQFGRIENPVDLHQQLKLTVGVVETGLFTACVDKVVISDGQTVSVREVGM